MNDHMVFAYIDPGTGALLVQSLIAAAAAGLVFFRRHLSRLWHALTGRGKKSDQPPPKP